VLKAVTITGITTTQENGMTGTTSHHLQALILKLIFADKVSISKIKLNSTMGAALEFSALSLL
jgi:hypothetical protein